MTKLVGCAFHLPLLSLHHQSVGEHPNWMLQPKLHFTIRPDGSIVTNSRGWAKTKKALETEIIMAEKCPGWSPEVEGEFGWILWKLATESLEKHLNCPSFLSQLWECVTASPRSLFDKHYAGLQQSLQSFTNLDDCHNGYFQRRRHFKLEEACITR